MITVTVDAKDLASPRISFIIAGQAAVRLGDIVTTVTAEQAWAIAAAWTEVATSARLTVAS